MRIKLKIIEEKMKKTNHLYHGVSRRPPHHGLVGLENLQLEVGKTTRTK